MTLPVNDFVDAPPDHRPIAQIVGDPPDQLDVCRAELADLPPRRPQKGFRRLPGGFGKDQQELSAAARTKQDARQSLFRQ